MLEELSKKVRAKSLISLFKAESGHPGGVLSSIDIILYLFLKEMNFDPKNYDKKNRDRFILSKGHCAAALYAVASECGIIDESRQLEREKVKE